MLDYSIENDSFNWTFISCMANCVYEKYIVVQMPKQETKLDVLNIELTFDSN